MSKPECETMRSNESCPFNLSLGQEMVSSDEMAVFREGSLMDGTAILKKSLDDSLARIEQKGYPPESIACVKRAKSYIEESQIFERMIVWGRIAEKIYQATGRNIGYNLAGHNLAVFRVADASVEWFEDTEQIGRASDLPIALTAAIIHDATKGFMSLANYNNILLSSENRQAIDEFKGTGEETTDDSTAMSFFLNTIASNLNISRDELERLMDVEKAGLWGNLPTEISQLLTLVRERAIPEVLGNSLAAVHESLEHQLKREGGDEELQSFWSACQKRLPELAMAFAHPPAVEANLILSGRVSLALLSQVADLSVSGTRFIGFGERVRRIESAYQSGLGDPNWIRMSRHLRFLHTLMVAIEEKTGFVYPGIKELANYLKDDDFPYLQRDIAPFSLAALPADDQPELQSIYAVEQAIREGVKTQFPDKNPVTDNRKIIIDYAERAIAAAEATINLQRAIVSGKENSIQAARQEMSGLITNELQREPAEVLAEREILLVEGIIHGEGLACILSLNQFPGICREIAKRLNIEEIASKAYQQLQQRLVEIKPASEVNLDGVGLLNFPLQFLKDSHLSVRTSAWEKIRDLLSEFSIQEVEESNPNFLAYLHTFKKIMALTNFGDDRTIFQLSGSMDSDSKCVSRLIQAQKTVLEKLGEIPKVSVAQHTIFFGTTGSPFGLHHREVLKAAIKALEKENPEAFIEAHVHIDDLARSKAQEHLRTDIPLLQLRKQIAVLQTAIEPQILVTYPSVPIAFDRRWNQQLRLQLIHEVPSQSAVWRVTGADEVIEHWRNSVEPDPYRGIDHIVNLRDTDEDDVRRIFYERGYNEPLIIKIEGIASRRNSTLIRQDLRRSGSSTGITPEALAFIRHHMIKFKH